ncbi:ferredoxin [Desulfovibrio ferrophilus]|uniref:4Fe-4S ferredoxin-type domain-containing protein n=1 Tax=Desulfovibrio ferrophilus TaxID=241368 RepID=A0A2Z6AUH2_9BACT|nr:ferredoxin [Desulfovibrio ferrophilus]BBD06881.1 uncharacterized protein DFE_0155 [Desulfovibrio ferrophilus]
MTAHNNETQLEYCVNTTECSGCLACVEMCPDLFGWDDINEQVIIKKECADADEVAQAMAYCPNDCIESPD